MRTLSRYFVARYLGLFAAILVSSMLAISIVDMLLGHAELLDADLAPSGLLRQVFLRVPSYYLPDLIPIAAFAAAFFSLGIGVRWLELTAVKAAGISPHRISAAILLAATLLAGLTLALNETLVTSAARGWNAQRRATDQALSFRQGTFWYHKGSWIYNIGSADPESQTLRGVSIYQRTERGRLIAQIQADVAVVAADGSWQLENANVLRFDPERPEQAPQYASELALELPASTDPALLMRQADAASLSLGELAEYLRIHASDRHAGSATRLRQLRTVLHSRSSEPLLVILFTLLAIPIALRIPAGGNMTPASLWALATIGAFQLARSLGDTLASEGVVSGAPAVWGVIVAFTLWGALGLARTAR